MYKAFIEPDLRTAHIKITNKFNPFTGFQNPSYILKVWHPFFFVQVFLFAQLACNYPSYFTGLFLIAVK